MISSKVRRVCSLSRNDRGMLRNMYIGVHVRCSALMVYFFVTFHDYTINVCLYFQRDVNLMLSLPNAYHTYTVMVGIVLKE